VIPGTHIVIPGLTRNLFSSKNYCILKFFYDLCHWYDEQCEYVVVALLRYQAVSRRRVHII
ncbi:MAG: hypothetical protein IKX37_06245, partial [Bacteroidales bacterium]|nr:hypothetical protein [Bacteroidales bacterium]